MDMQKWYSTGLIFCLVIDKCSMPEIRESIQLEFMNYEIEYSNLSIWLVENYTNWENLYIVDDSKISVSAKVDLTPENMILYKLIFE